MDRYLSDPSKKLDDNFDVLAWWKGNEFKYGVLSRIAQDVLVIYVLTPKTVEDLICTQNWISRK